MADLIELFHSRRAVVGVLGLGYVGLPLAISFVEAGLTVDGVDAFAGRVAELNAGTSPIDDVSDERLRSALSSGLSVCAPAETDLAAADAIFVCVPTPITATKDPDLGPVLAAGETVRGGLRRGQLVVLQSTTFGAAPQAYNSAGAMGGNFGIGNVILFSGRTPNEDYIVQDAAGEWIERVATLQLQERSK